MWRYMVSKAEMEKTVKEMWECAVGVIECDSDQERNFLGGLRGRKQNGQMEEQEIMRKRGKGEKKGRKRGGEGGGRWGRWSREWVRKR